MHIERFTPQVRRSLVQSRGRVESIDATPEADNPFADRRRLPDRRKNNETIKFSNRRERKDRRKQVDKASATKPQDNLGQNIDITI